MSRKASRPGRCTCCGRRREVYSIGRTGGGSYRRGGRRYTSSICGECATDLLRRAPVHAGATAQRYSVSTLDDVVSSLGTEEAAEVFTSYRERRDADRQRLERARATGQWA